MWFNAGVCRALLSAGFHEFADLGALERLCVEGFPRSRTRGRLMRGLREYVAFLVGEVGIEVEIWIDGSFVSDKENPNDVDLLILVAGESVAGLGGEERNMLYSMTADAGRSVAQSDFYCDVYFCFVEDEWHKSAWRGWYGFDRRENPKGIARIRILP